MQLLKGLTLPVVDFFRGFHLVFSVTQFFQQLLPANLEAWKVGT